MADKILFYSGCALIALTIAAIVHMTAQSLILADVLIGWHTPDSIGVALGPITIQWNTVGDVWFPGRNQ